MDYEQERVWEMVKTIPWSSGAVIRLFWIRYSNGARANFASSLATQFNGEAVLALVVRKHSFFSANAMLSDVVSLFDESRPEIEALTCGGVERLTVLLIGKDDFRLVQAASQINLPDWFPVCAGMEKSFVISDLAQTAEATPLNCPEGRIDHVSELFFEFEAALVNKLREIYGTDPERVARFGAALQITPTPSVGDMRALIEHFEEHIASIADPRSYRPNAAADSKFLSARLLKIALNNSPKQLGAIASAMAPTMLGSDAREIKPTFFAIAWRPAAKMTVAQSNWHGIMVALFQAYQLMNGSAHAGEYPAYPVALQHSMSLNLRNYLTQARQFVEGLA